MVAAVQYERPGPFTRRSLWAMAVLGLVAVVMIAFVGPELPSTTLILDGKSVGAPLVGGTVPVVSATTVLAEVLPGTFRAELSYRLAGPADGAKWEVLCVSTRDSVSSMVSTSLQIGAHVASIGINCDHPGTLDSQLTAPPDSRLDVPALRLQKTAD